MSATNITLELKHLATGELLNFKVRIKRYEQNVKPNFASAQVYARMDPIFTYQNTVRNFMVDCHTLLDRQGGYDATTTRKKISKLYKFMYPAYEKEVHGLSGITTHTLKGPPILSLKAPGLLTAGGVATGDIIFVPETFSLTSGLADSEKIQYVVGGPEDLRYLAPAGGYGFTLGGTILHQKEPPGWLIESGSTGTTLRFSKDNFPLGVE